MQETVFPGDGRSIEGLQWTQDPNDVDADGQVILGQYRLFSIASSPAVTEWDLATGQPKRRSTGNFSEVWCVAAQPGLKPQQGEEPPSQDIIAGCGDGTLVLLSTADSDLQFKRFLARVSGAKARCMCITYQSRDRVVAGFADSMIRIYDTRNGSVLRNMSLGSGVPGAPKNSLVWQVRCLPNGDIVSGDSNGEVKFWDGKTYSQTQRISGHDTDCLDLVTSSDGRTVFSGSIDGKISVYRQSSDSRRKTWARTSHRRVHSGEVKSMTAFDSKGLSVVVSGGSDVAPMVTPLRAYGEENLRSLPSLPQTRPVASAPKARLLVSWWEKTICIWRIARNSGDAGAPEHQKPRKLVARINLSAKNNIQSVSITSDGRMLAASTNTEVKVFQLRRRIEYDSLAIRKLEVPDNLATSGARLLLFSPDGKWLVSVTPESEVYIARLTLDSKEAKHIRVLHSTVELERQDRKSKDQTGFREYDRTITRAAFAPDATVLVVGDISGYLDSWLLEGNEDLTMQPVMVAKADSQSDSSDGDSDSDSDSSGRDDDAMTMFYGQHWTDNPSGHLLPKLESSPLVMTFRPTSRSSNPHTPVNGNIDPHSTGKSTHVQSVQLPREQHRLWIMTAKHQMFEFDILAGRLTGWSRRNPSAVLPEDFSKIRDRVMGALWDIGKQKERLWLYGSTFVCMLNVGGDLDSVTDPQTTRKRSRKAKDGAADEVAQKRRKLESGAGGPIDVSRKEGVTGPVGRYEGGTWTDVDLDRVHQRAQDDDEEDDEDVGLQLTRVGRSGDEQVAADDLNHSSTRERKWWCTFKYRPVLGIVPLSDEADDEPLEVVLVERVQSEQR